MSDEIRKKIVEEAGELFHTYGFKRVSMDEIAGKSRISKKTLYAVFSSKDEIMRAALEVMTENLVNQMSDLLDKTLPIDKTFREFSHIIKQVRFALSKPMLNDLKDMPDLFSIIDEKRKKIIKKFEGVLKENIKKGEVRKGLNTTVFMNVLMSAVETLVNPVKMIELNISPGDLIEQIISILFFGIYKDNGGK